MISEDQGEYLSQKPNESHDLYRLSMVIKTGCSASLVALHEACRALQSGDCTSAIVAGTNLILGPTTTAAMTSEGILSPEGSCKTFDAAADGFARAEAITAIYLKPVDSAIRDNNPIRAVIRNTGTNSDGKSASLMSPNGESHEMLIRKVYADIGLDPQETAFVECHGTGTPTGDPIETSAVANVFGEKGVHIGSVGAPPSSGLSEADSSQVKPNMGHSEGASGITSLIKCILALEKRVIPPNVKFANPNPKSTSHIRILSRMTLKGCSSGSWDRTQGSRGGYQVADWTEATHKYQFLRHRRCQRGMIFTSNSEVKADSCSSM